MVVDWEIQLVHGSFGRITALATNAGGVLAAGADSHEREQSEAIVASFTRDGRPRYRVTLDQPRSTMSPGRAVAVAIAAGAGGEAYVVASAALQVGSAAVALSLLDARGRVLFARELELSAQHASLVIDASGDAVVVGSSLAGHELTLLKVARDGTRGWTRSYPFEGAVPRLLRFGDGLALVGSLHGTAQFGDAKLTRRESVPYHCAGQEAVCEDGATSLLVAELDALGNPLRARLLGAPTSRLVMSDAAVTRDGRILVTGEYSGPASELGKVSLCELEPGMPEAEENAFRETGWDRHVCTCRSDRRDLFLLELGPGAEPRWAKTLALGTQAPRIVASDGGELRWGAELARVPDATETRGPPNPLALWSLTGDGVVNARRSAPVGFRNMAGGDGALYVSDAHVLRKTKW
jgi:hypothetical protein